MNGYAIMVEHGQYAFSLVYLLPLANYIICIQGQCIHQ